MSTVTLDDFKGRFFISQGSISDKHNSQDPRHLVVTGNLIVVNLRGPKHPDEAEFTLFDMSQKPPQPKLTLAFYFDPVNGVLKCRDDDYEGTGQPLSVQISIYLDDKSKFKTIYGVMLFGDPENVGVWGADDSDD